jgi:hypothetical protein
MMRRLLLFLVGLGLFGLAADAKPKGIHSKATHPVVIPHHAHAAPKNKPHFAEKHKAPHHDLAYTPKKPKHFKLAKP